MATNTPIPPQDEDQINRQMLPAEIDHCKKLPGLIMWAMQCSLNTTTSEPPRAKCVCSKFDTPAVDPPSVDYTEQVSHDCCDLYYPAYYISIFDGDLENHLFSIKELLVDEFKAKEVQVSTMFAMLSYVHYWFAFRAPDEINFKPISAKTPHSLVLLFDLLKRNHEQFCLPNTTILLEDFFLACVFSVLNIFFWCRQRNQHSLATIYECKPLFYPHRSLRYSIQDHSRYTKH